MTLWMSLRRTEGQRPDRGGREAPSRGEGRALPGLSAGPDI